MWIILPNRVNGLPTLEGRLRRQISLEYVQGRFQPKQKMYVMIPKFNLDVSLDAKRMLRQLGVVDLFNPREANMSAMSCDSDGLFVSDALHRVVIKVDEQGTEAAAATGDSFSPIQS